jgi:hypothetical protein
VRVFQLGNISYCIKDYPAAIMAEQQHTNIGDFKSTAAADYGDDEDVKSLQFKVILLGDGEKYGFAVVHLFYILWKN